MARQNTRLEGENIAPATIAEARALVGCKVEVLRTTDIDHSGRGYIFPCIREVTGAYHRTIELDGDPQSLSRIVEMRLVSRPEENGDAQ